MDKVFLLGGLRSHIGLTGGMFKNIPAEQLAAAVLKKVIEKYPYALQADGLICGNAVGTGGNITRLAALLAGLPVHVPALTVDMQCASAAASIELAMAKIGCGLADILIAGGFESTSMQPTRVYAKADVRYKAEGFTVAQFSPDTESAKVMLEGAERTCQKHGFTREELDAFAVRSHQLANKAREEGNLRDVVVSVFGSIGDEGIRDRMSPKLAARMPKLFTAEEVAVLLEENSETQTVPLLTAANACLTNDGAAFVILISQRAAEKYNLLPEMELLSGFEWGVDPRYSPEGAIETGQHLLEHCGLQPERIDVFEYNEAFAVISALFARKYPALTERYCLWGGALAYGHPYGASGAILLLHLWQELKQRKGTLGLLSIAGAGGLGTALLVKNLRK
ncbi:MAG: thiolase family protein [Acidaminococcaceae bacterium]|nr:thiolase family protein [Acidaminococcaceae bacterium]